MSRSADKQLGGERHVAGSLGTFIQQLRRAVGPEGGSGLTDAQLLERFVVSRDEAAFEVLVWRHGPTVLGACRRMLRREQDVEDAFQATFLTLARKAGSIRQGAALAGWLHRVACRAALLARAGAARQCPTQALPEDTLAGPIDSSLDSHDLRAVLDEEVSRLPDRYRVPFVLCHLEGKTGREAAALLGCPVSTVACRLTRACRRLRVRLTRRGVTLSASALAALGADRATALPATLVMTAVEAMGTGRAVPAGAAILAQGVLRALRMARLRVVGAVLLALGLLGVAGGVAAYHLGGGEPAPVTPGVSPPAPPHNAFRPVADGWIKKINYLDARGAGDPPNGYKVVAPADRDPARKDYYKEVRYYEKSGDAKARRIERYDPAGRLEQEIDNVGDEQFSRSLGPDGAVRSYLRWQAGKWLDGYSVGPDGKEKHRLAKGAGELAFYGREAGNRLHRWYDRAQNFLDKRYQDGRCIEVRLNLGSDWLIASRDGNERLLLESKKEIWHKAPGAGVLMQELDKVPIFERRERQAVEQWQKEFPLRRAAFLEAFGALLRQADRTWEGLGIDFLRKGAAWPD
jgi:RNA polymerase sigma factor (sigma-70 family)